MKSSELLSPFTLPDKSQSALTCHVVDAQVIEEITFESITPSIPEGIFIPEEVGTGIAREEILEPGEPLVLTERGVLYQALFVTRRALHELMDASANTNCTDPRDTAKALGRKRFTRQWENYQKMQELSESLGFSYDARIVDQKQQEFNTTVKQASDEIARNFRYAEDIDRIPRTATIFEGAKNNGNA